MHGRTDLPTVVALAVGLSLSAGPTSAATDYFVDPDCGSDDNTGLNPECDAGSDGPLATIQFGTTKVSPGDTLFLKGGVYTNRLIFESDERPQANGQPDAPITMTAYEDHEPTLLDLPVVIRELEWWVFDELVLDKTPVFIGDDSEGSCTGIPRNLIFKNIIFKNGGMPPRRHGMRLDCAAGLTIEGNIFDNIRSREEGVDSTGVAIFQASDVSIRENVFRDIGSDGIIFTLHSPASDVIIEDNEFFVARPYRYRDQAGNCVEDDPSTDDVDESQLFGNVGENAIDIKNSTGGIVIRRNIISGYRPTVEGQDASGAAGDAVNLHQHAFGISVERNLIFDNTTHVAVGIGTQGDRYESRQTDVINNLLINSISNADSVFQAGIRVGLVSDVRILGNTVYNDTYDGQVLIRSNGVMNGEIKDNIFHNGRWRVRDDRTQDWDSDYNAWSAVVSDDPDHLIHPALAGPNDVVTDDAMISTDTRRPDPSSPVVDAGVDLGTGGDFYGRARVGRVDIGAVELGARTTGESTRAGTVTGSHADTHASDDAYEVLEEVHPEDNSSRTTLDHQWAIDISDGSGLTLIVEARRPSSKDDSFVFSYSLDGLVFTPMFELEATSTDVVETFRVPETTADTLYMRVEDTGDETGDPHKDSVYVDHIYVESPAPNPRIGSAEHPCEHLLD